MATEDFRLPLLTKDSYQRWKYEVDGLVRCPVGHDKEKDIETWMKTDGKAQRILTYALSDDDHAAILLSNSTLWSGENDDETTTNPSDTEKAPSKNPQTKEPGPSRKRPTTRSRAKTQKDVYS
ncbi:hypothetical protein EAG_05293 [Camponotus floridanus]|uniref:Uncharacterized protein n=1 Tax=Camponotus floridanus TaxID=104421 RepID=E2A035_CAMFO|nr:hypothetical protein EAG_05293 [Camponotus floridanus]